MDFGQPNAEIGLKMANGQLLFLALHSVGSSRAEHNLIVLTNYTSDLAVGVVLEIVHS